MDHGTDPTWFTRRDFAGLCIGRAGWKNSQERAEERKSGEIMQSIYLDISCGHCGKVATIDTAGAGSVEISMIGAKHTVGFTMPPGSYTIPAVLNDGGLNDLSVSPQPTGYCLA